MKNELRPGDKVRRRIRYELPSFNDEYRVLAVTGMTVKCKRIADFENAAAVVLRVSDVEKIEV